MKILFVTNNMPFGGVERALIDNVRVLQALGHDVDLLLREKTGGFLDQLPSGVDVHELPLSKMDRYEVDHGRVPTLRYAVTHGHLYFAVRMLWMRLRWVLSGRRKNYDYEVVRAAVTRTPRTLTTDYNLAIAYSADYAWSTIMTLDWVMAKRKICWCHGERCSNRFSKQLYRDFYSHFDGHYACSQATANRINDALSMPGLVKGFPHLVNAEEIKAKGDFPIDDACYSGDPILLTVGRVGEQKASDAAVRVCRRLKDNGFAGKWFWIGSGTAREEQELKDQIVASRAQDCFIFMGPKQNPYPYIKVCDLYIQPSRYEGYCLTVAEARVFNRPIITTDFDGAREQLKPDQTGIIVPEDDENALTDAIQDMLADRKKMETLSNNLKLENPSTAELVRESWRVLAP